MFGHTAWAVTHTCNAILLEIHCTEEVGTVEIGLRKVDWEERKEVGMWQAIATLVDVSFRFQAVERCQRVTIVGGGGYNEA